MLCSVLSIDRVRVIVENLYSVREERPRADCDLFASTEDHTVTYVHVASDSDTPIRFVSEDTPDHGVETNLDPFGGMQVDQPCREPEPDAGAQPRSRCELRPHPAQEARVIHAPRCPVCCAPRR